MQGYIKTQPVLRDSYLQLLKVTARSHPAREDFDLVAQRLAKGRENNSYISQIDAFRCRPGAIIDTLVRH